MRMGSRGSGRMESGISRILKNYSTSNRRNIFGVQWYTELKMMKKCKRRSGRIERRSGRIKGGRKVRERRVEIYIE